MSNRSLTMLSIIIFIADMLCGPSSSVAAAEGAQAPTQVNNYETPCHYRERVSRGIPAYSVHGGGLLAYVDRHLDGRTPDAELADFWAALDACDRNEAVGRWDWDSMILTSVQYLG